MVAGTHFANDIEPLLIEYCYDCHGDGSNKGQVALDELSADPKDAETWHRVLKNVRANLMPPHDKPQPKPEEIALLSQWVKHDALGIDPQKPDPGPPVLRRLNRTEYQNTIRDLVGIEFRADIEFPPDDSGYGFDNIGSVLTLSPLLLEKYLKAAEKIVAEAFPLVRRLPAEQPFTGRDFRSADEKEGNASRLPFDEERFLVLDVHAPIRGEYNIHLDVEVDGAFNYDPGRARVLLSLDNVLLSETEHAWKPSDRFHYTFQQQLNDGHHEIQLHLQPTQPTEDPDERIHYEVHRVRLEGPLSPAHWVKPPRYDHFYLRDTPPHSAEEQATQAREMLRQFAERAFRRPPSERTLDRLVSIASDTYNGPDKSFAEGIARALVAVLASPRFLLRIDHPVEAKLSQAETHPLVDEYSLASRLSYFLWSSMPDDKLFDLAKRRQLRAQLRTQIQRMLNDPKAEALTQNFVGQWLQARDISSISIDARAVLARENPEDPEIKALRERYIQLIRRPRESLNPAELTELQDLRSQRRRIFRQPRVDFGRELRSAMRQETELVFEHIVKEDRSLLELIDADYTFLNETLANHYGIKGVEGRQMRRVSLPDDNPRGGILTQGTMLAVTSNPTRTSPVKRGLFILENILGTPPPPPPADVPDLESVTTPGREPTLREALAIHRESPLCRSCHNRMDPLGLSLEHFNAMGIWRDQELNQPIDAAGQLVTGEKFNSVNELKRILATERRDDFYRCFTEKLLTYALGRGLEPRDIETLDQIMAAIHAEGDRLSVILDAIIKSPVFQNIRRPSHPEDSQNRQVAGTSEK